MSSISKTVKHLGDLDLAGKRLLIRQDLNVPVRHGVVTSDVRIRASIPTLQLCVDAGASILIMSHLGRPTEGEYDDKYSLGPVAKRLGELLGMNVPLVTDYLENPPEIASGEIVMLENVRFNVGEKSNEETLAKQYASLCDIFVMDAFGTAHRAQASTYGAGVHAADACAGLLLGGELQALGKAMEAPAKPLVAIVGGSKVSTKLTVLDSLSGVVDQLIVGGGIANTFIAASGYPVGKSLYEADLVSEAARLMEAAIKRGAEIPVPVDVVCGKEFAENTPASIKKVAEIETDDLVFDIGPETAAIYSQILAKAGTIVWNGPVGVFEFDQFGAGTKAMADAIAASSGFSIAGGGDTLAAIDKYGISDEVSYISTGGGAFLEFLEGKKLPAVEMLEARIDV